MTSKYAVVRWDGGKAEVVAPFGDRTIEFDDARLLSLLHAFATPRPLQGLAPSLLGAARALVASGVLERADRERSTPWVPHDAVYHVLSRLGRGGTYRFLGKRPPLPLFKPKMKALRVLKLPTAETLPDEGPSLFAALAARRSRRDFRSAPLSLAEVGALLDVVARNRAVREGEHGLEVGRRAYPSGGGMYPLELYPLVRPGACAGLEAGIYHYRPDDHTLELLARPKKIPEWLPARALGAAHVAGDAWLLFHVTARMGRTGWKYEGTAYSLMLKELGCLLQTIYLAAGALGLGACAVGGGHLDALADTVGLDPWEEPQIGEFFVGRPAPLPDGAGKPSSKRGRRSSAGR